MSDLAGWRHRLRGVFRQIRAERTGSSSPLLQGRCFVAARSRTGTALAARRSAVSGYVALHVCQAEEVVAIVSTGRGVPDQQMWIPWSDPRLGRPVVRGSPLQAQTTCLFWVETFCLRCERVPGIGLRGESPTQSLRRVTDGQGQRAGSPTPTVVLANRREAPPAREG